MPISGVNVLLFKAIADKQVPRKLIADFAATGKTDLSTSSLRELSSINEWTGVVAAAR
jgi:hypothetical protein